MRNGNELADYFGVTATPQSLRQVQLRLKRLAGGLRNESKVESYGLTDKERAALNSAVDVLLKLEKHHGAAIKVREKQINERKVQENQLRTAMKANFLALTSVADKVAFIGAICSRYLQNGSITSLRALDEQFKEAIDSLIYRLRPKLAAGTHPDLAVAEAWATFQGGRPKIEADFGWLISRLTNLSQ